ncbi:MAG: Sua5/YciO/YrdC/YwlC family protein [Campylobacteraceae bacterium]|jgi:tRNA A37 threonylcarbamoyladenosine synthetase subunit TsaC/SUA5/YrdC|nr:Sua5/YciO/YrdC/YwlC family protein [Campylobacteraceae bacterium]
MNKSKQLVYLAQSDTTVGLLSSDKIKLNKIKNRPPNKPCIECLCSVHTKNIRVPKEHKNLVRRSHKTTFVLQNGYSFRIVKNSLHADFLEKFGNIYSTSANETNKHFDFNFAYNVSDVIVEDERSLFEAYPSQILKIGKNKIKKIR